MVVNIERGSKCRIGIAYKWYARERDKRINYRFTSKH